MQIEEFLEHRLINYVEDKDQNPLGNVIMIQEGDDYERVHILWDIPFITSEEAIMFQMIYLSQIANTLSEFVDLPITTSESRIEVTTNETPVPFAQSDIFKHPDHFKSHIQMEVSKLVSNNREPFVVKVKSIFRKTIWDIRMSSLSI